MDKTLKIKSTYATFKLILNQSCKEILKQKETKEKKPNTFRCVHLHLYIYVVMFMWLNM
jgi:hypothetical protein